MSLTLTNSWSNSFTLAVDGDDDEEGGEINVEGNTVWSHLSFSSM